MSRKKAKMEATAYDDPALLRVIRNKKGEIVAFGRTRLGQAAYAVMLSSMSAAEAARRHKLKREWVLKMRRDPHVKKLRMRKKKHDYILYKSNGSDQAEAEVVTRFDVSNLVTTFDGESWPLPT